MGTAVRIILHCTGQFIGEISQKYGMYPTELLQKLALSQPKKEKYSYEKWIFY